MISHKKNFIFIHLQKTGGSSIEYNLKEYSDSQVLLDSNNTVIDDKHLSFFKRNKGWKSLENVFSSNELDNFLKFTIVRNPWDRMVSWWKWSVNDNTFSHYVSFREFLLINEFRLWKIPQIDCLTDSMGKLNVDYVGKFETLEFDVRRIYEKLDLEYKELPHINAMSRKHYSEYFTDDLIEVVRNMHLKDIEYFNYEFEDKKIRPKNISFNIFYHNKKLLDKVIQDVNDKRFNYVDLNSIELPEYLIINDLSKNENRAVFSEYLGFLNFVPTTDMVGFFTYSIPIKFSHHWAKESNNSLLFVPQIKFSDLSNISYYMDKLYAVELNNPLNKFKNEILDIHEKFQVGTSSISKQGAYKGSFIVSRDCFLKFQEWFKEVISYVIKKYDYKHWCLENSQYTLGTTSSKNDDNYLEIDKLRHGIGELLERCVAYYFGQTYESSHKMLLNEHLYATNKDKKYYNLAHKLKIENKLIVAVANNKYSDIVENWLLHINKLKIKNYLIIALDKELYIYLINKNYNVFYDPLKITSIFDLWKKRVEIYKQTVEIGVDIVHSDPDAVWLRDPMEDYFSNKNNYDLIFSEGTAWPKKIYEKWGFILCCGLFYAKASPKTVSLFNEMLNKLHIYKDDQATINNILYEDEIEWVVIDKKVKQFNDNNFIYSDKLISGIGKNYKIQILPHNLFQRIHIKKIDAYIKHIFSDKTNINTKRILKKCGCYIKQDISFYKKLKKLIRKQDNPLYKRFLKLVRRISF